MASHAWQNYTPCWIWAQIWVSCVPLLDSLVARRKTDQNVQISLCNQRVLRSNTGWLLLWKRTRKQYYLLAGKLAKKKRKKKNVWGKLHFGWLDLKTLLVLFLFVKVYGTINETWRLYYFKLNFNHCCSFNLSVVFLGGIFILFNWL